MIVDVNAFSGRWPFRRLAFSGAAGLATLLRRVGIAAALVSPIASAFYRDPLTALEEMLEDPGWEPGLMRPVGSLNPNYPGWEQDLQTMVRLGCVAIRLIPNYHAYRLYDEPALSLVRQVHGLGLPVILTTRMQDERSHHWHMSVPAVPLDEVRFLLRDQPEGKYVLSNISWQEVQALRPEIEQAATVAWEVSYKPPPSYVERAVAQFGAERVLFGTCAPLQYPEAALMVIKGAHISEDDRALLLGGNARRLFGLGGQNDR